MGSAGKSKNSEMSKIDEFDNYIGDLNDDFSQLSEKELREQFIKALVKDITKDIGAEEGQMNPEELISNGDIQSIVEAYAIEHKGTDEDKMLNDIRDAVEKALKGKENPDVFVYGNTNYTIVKKGKYYYLHSDYKGKNLGNIEDEWRIIGAKDPNKAYVKIPYVGEIHFNEEKKLVNMLKKALNQSTPTKKKK